jgi:outer membrane protein, heavy metal efflux system
MFRYFCGWDIRKLSVCDYNWPTRVMFIILVTVSPLNVIADDDKNELTLASAIQLAISKNPELQVYRFRSVMLQGRVLTANQRPALEFEVEIENVAGSNDFSGTDSAEITLALSSVIELGDKRQARVAAVGARHQLMESERQARALDLMGEVTRRYVDVVATQARLALAINTEQLALETTQSVNRRVRAGAAPEAELLRARAEHALTTIAVAQEQNRLHRARVSLSLLWAEPEPDFVRVKGNLLDLGAVGNFERLFTRAVQNPAIEVFASEKRLLDAEVRLTQTQSRNNIGWSFGAKQFQETDDSALVASISVPLFSAKRNRGASQSARAARDEVFFRREAAILKLRAQLFDAYQQHKQAVSGANSLQENVIPLLKQALKQTRKAYESGRYGYQEWVAARQELIAAKYALIGSANAALRYRSEIEQLTAEPMLAPISSAAE